MMERLKELIEEYKAARQRAEDPDCITMWRAKNEAADIAVRIANLIANAPQLTGKHDEVSKWASN